MHRRVVLSLAILMGLAATAQAVPTIVVGAHPLTPFAAAVSFDINVSGLGASPNSLSALDLWVSIASESTGAAPLGEPSITNVDVVTGTVYTGNSAFAAPGQVSFSSSQVWNVGNITNAGVITTNGKLFTVTLNTLGATANAVYALRVFGVDPADGPFDSVYSNDQVIGVTFEGSNGSFQMVPEPSSIALGLFAVAGLGVVAVRRRRARA